MRRSVLSVALISIATAACGSTDDESAAGDTSDAPGMTAEDPTDTTMTSDDPADPDPMTGDPPLEAGTNGTMPCDPELDTGYVGDELCIQPPDPGTGIHMHAGPIDYDNPDEVAPFLILPGEENTDYFTLTTDNVEPSYFFKQFYRMRPGSHHLIISMWDQPLERGWYDSRSDIPGSRLIIIGGTQRSSMDFPEGGVAPEDELLFRPVNPATGMAFQLHFVNATDKPILREAWVNFMDNENAFPNGIILGAPFLIGDGFAVPPGAHQVLNYTAVHELEEPMRIVSLFGHRHANSVRFTVWAHREGQRDLIYEDYDWNEPAELFYNTVVQNPAPDPGALQPGGYSGIINLVTGDALEWECEVINERSVTLYESNEVYDGEMCNLFGTLTLPGVPIWRDSPPLVCSGDGC